MEGNSVLRLLLYLAVLIPCTGAYSFSPSKNTNPSRNVFFTPMATKEREESHLKWMSQNAQEDYNTRKEKSATKMNKKLNRLFKTLYPNEAQMKEREKKEPYYQGRSMEGMQINQGIEDNNRSYDGVRAATYSAVARGSNDEAVRNSRRKGGFPSGNVLNRQLPSSYPAAQRGETTLHSVDSDSNVSNDSEKPSYNDTKGAETAEHHSSENIERSQDSDAENDANQQSPLHLFGQSEKLKSESKFALMDYLKELFQKSTYMKRFQNFIEIFFNKYDQRVLESTVFFNFDETLF
ncbi:hypothetical protein C922_03864 [Plasmodium inui San Antonio 1]|uniref:Merozoite surface protein C-terminal domain-containing protein n=1 Tax=Plasmodium inui San Antonio 1 TaxID=1237626 RepID=W7A2Q1_9APIC|nr:hypothetical protein C922_03864 [Plasmodium inui San Antonio 1]EUD65618.1 hypothetical protein C922_03864 [Plasmodium inui San Antonio 1]